MKTRLESQNFLTLDGGRGVGAVLVVLGHSAMFWPGFPTLPLVPLVDIFFILSGFVLAFAYEPRFDKGMTTRQFMLARVVRLYPLYILGIAMGTLVHLYAYYGDSPETSLSGLLLNSAPAFLMIPWMDPNSEYIYAANVPAWTLFFELVINLLYILIYPLIRRMSGLLVVVTLSIGLFLAMAVYYDTTDLGSRWTEFWGGFGRVGCTFFTGVLIYRLMGKPKETSSRRSLISVPLILLILFYGIGAPEPWSLIRDIILVTLVGPVLLWLFLIVQPPRWLQTIFASLGGMSYALYILHFPVYETVKRIAWKYPVILETPALGSFIVLGISMAISFVAWQWYDEPVRAAINKWLKERRKRTAAATAPQAAESVVANRSR
jgi:peptidoglycan/LPS O-acetylase OafA/YrhL